MKLIAINTIYGVIPVGKTEGPAKPGDVFEVKDGDGEVLKRGGFAKDAPADAAKAPAKAAAKASKTADAGADQGGNAPADAAS